MWHDINTDADIEALMKETGYFHDTVVVTANYTSGDHAVENGLVFAQGFDSHELSVIFDGDWIKRLKLKFTGVRKFSFCGLDDLELPSLLECTLEFRTDLRGRTRDERLILWADAPIDPLTYEDRALLSGQLSRTTGRRKGTSYVIAEKLQWRYVEE